MIWNTFILAFVLYSHSSSASIYDDLKFETTCHKDRCYGTWSNPVPNGKQWVEWDTYSNHGCCAFWADACDRCSDPKKVIEHTKGTSSCYVDGNHLRGITNGECVQNARIYEGTFIRDKWHCLGATENGQVIRYDCDESDTTMIWTYTPDSGLFKNHGKKGDRCLQAEDKNSAQLKVAKCNPDESTQQWDYHIDIKQIRLRRTPSSQKKCIDDAGGKHRLHSNMQVYDCWGGENQQYMLYQMSCNDVSSLDATNCGVMETTGSTDKIQLAVTCESVPVGGLTVHLEGKKVSGTISASINDQKHKIGFSSSDFKYSYSSPFNILAGDYMLTITGEFKNKNGGGLNSNIRHVTLLESNQPSENCKFMLNAYSEEYHDDWCNAAYDNPLDAHAMIQIGGTYEESNVEWYLWSFDESAKAKCEYDGKPDTISGFEPLTCANGEVCQWSQSRAISELYGYSLTDGTRFMSASHLRMMISATGKSPAGEYLPTLTITGELETQASWETEMSFEKSESREFSESVETSTTLGCENFSFKYTCVAERKTTKVSITSNIYPVVKVNGHSIDCHADGERTVPIHTQYKVYSWTAAAHPFCEDDPICAGQKLADCMHEASGADLVQLCPLLCAPLSVVRNTCRPKMKCGFMPIPRTECNFDMLDPRSGIDRIAKCADSYGAFNEVCEADNPFVKGEGPEDWMIDNCGHIPADYGDQYVEYHMYRWTCWGPGSGVSIDLMPNWNDNEEAAKILDDYRGNQDMNSKMNDGNKKRDKKKGKRKNRKGKRRKGKKGKKGTAEKISIRASKKDEKPTKTPEPVESTSQMSLSTQDSKVTERPLVWGFAIVGALFLLRLSFNFCTKEKTYNVIHEENENEI